MNRRSLLALIAGWLSGLNPFKFNLKPAKADDSVHKDVYPAVITGTHQGQMFKLVVWLHAPRVSSPEGFGWDYEPNKTGAATNSRRIKCES